MINYVICIPIVSDTEHGARMFLARMRAALAGEALLNSENLSKIFIAECDPYLKQDLEDRALEGNH